MLECGQIRCRQANAYPCGFSESGTGSILQRGYTLRVTWRKDVVRVVNRLQNLAFFRIEAFHHSRLLLICLGMPRVTHVFAFHRYSRWSLRLGQIVLGKKPVPLITTVTT